MVEENIPTDLWSDVGLWDSQPGRFGRCLLHIGMEKTGTTSLQDRLGAARSALLAAGYFVPRSLSPYAVRANHERLTTVALADGKLNDDLRRNARIVSLEDVTAHRQSVAGALRAEIDGLPGAVDRAGATLLLSNEHCQSRLTTVAEVTRLRTLLGAFAREIRVIVYLRPQHEVAISLYDQALKAGYADIPLPPDFSGRLPLWVHRGFFDYADLLGRWAEVFGADAIEVRIYDRREWQDGDMVDDFLRRLGLDPAAVPRSADGNSSLGAARQVALNAVNRLARMRGVALSPGQRNGLIEALGRGPRTPGRRPERRAAQAFFHGFALGNEAVRMRFRPDRDLLFDPDFDQFPETEESYDEALALAEALLTQQEAMEAMAAELRALRRAALPPR